ncbi:MAG: T9SS type A sorting domain-containing protein [Bacteroidetes bacterium]|nr:T9SS type A sorting domain-containing protein [Bacteroidota bacterium]
MHRPTRASRATVVPFLLFLCLHAHSVLAQTPPPASGSYRYYYPLDSTFKLTGTNISDWDVVQEFHLDFIRQYIAYPADHFSGLIASTTPADPFTTAQRNFYRAMLAHNAPGSPKVITPVEGVGVNLKTARCVENYARVDPVLFHNLELAVVGDWGDNPKAMHNIAFGVTAPGGASTPQHTLLASGPRYLSQFAMFEGDSTLYARHPGLSGSYTSFRVSCAFKADTAELHRLTDQIGLDETIAYFVVYRRVRDNQPHDPGDDTMRCSCSAFAPIDTITITRRAYDNNLQFADKDLGYKEFGKTYELAVPGGDVLWKYDSTVFAKGPSGAYDQQVSRTQFFEKDTVTGTFYATDTTRNEIVGDRRIMVRNEHIRLTLIALRIHDELDWLHGDGWESFGPATCIHHDTCVNRLNRGVFGANALLDDDIFNSDIDIKFFTTQRVPVTFLRTRVNQDLYDHLRAGQLDSLEIAPATTKMYANDTLMKLLGRLAYSDEAFMHKYRGDGAVARTLQDEMHSHGDTTHQLWCDPVGNFDAFRVLTEDLDSSRLRTIHLIARQDYNQIGNFRDGIPIFYANPDLMCDFSNRVTFPKSQVPYPFHDPAHHDSVTRIDTAYFDCITPQSGYNAYTLRRQFGASVPGTGEHYCSGWGSFRESQTLEGTEQGATVTTLARAVTAAKFRYRQFGPSTQVWNSVQGMGWRVIYDPASVGADTAAIYPKWGSRPPTPEEITCQAWLSLNCGVNGLVFTDAQIDAANWGYVQQVTGKPMSNYGSWVPETWVGPSHGDTLKVLQPLMWTGFLDRYNAVKRINDEIRRIDPIIHISEMASKQEQMSVHDTVQTFRDMPWIDTLIAERSTPHDTNGLGVAIFNPTGSFDPRNQTYIELSHFGPGARDTAKGVEYFVITNRRTWPIDNLRYNARAQARGADNVGLGAIDVRRPWVRFKNLTNALVDSVLIDKVGHESEWPSRRVAVGDLVALDWITPGWGTYYRVRPIVAAVSTYGTAYNNAVHGVNPSTNAASLDRIFVLERDSAIFIRTMDSAGRWSGERLVSDAADTVTTTIAGVRRNTADNSHPAIGICRTSGSCAVVWERHDNATNKGTVELLWLPSLPSRTSFPVTGTVRTRLSPPRSFAQNWMMYTPAVTGVDSGYVVAWAAPNYTTEIMAVRDQPSNKRTDTSRTLRVKMKSLPTLPRDSATGYPSLAYARNWKVAALNGGMISGRNDTIPFTTVPDHIDGVPDTTGSYHILHLAYQQGVRTNASWEIMYNRLGVRFPVAGKGIPELWSSPTEIVSYNLQACNFRWPCVATDSARTGVTWTTTSGGHDHVALRFRNDDSLTPQQWRWNTVLYRWGGADFRIAAGQLPRYTFRDYNRSSLIQFPSRDTASLNLTYEGALTWQWTNTGDAQRHYGEKLYRFGMVGVDTVPDGQHPTMVMVPSIGNSAQHAITSASILHRGTDAASFSARRWHGDTALYYPAFVENTPSVPLAAFTQAATGATVLSSYNIMSDVIADQAGAGCNPPVGGLTAGLYRKYNIFAPGTTPPWEWGLPPTTFFPPGKGSPGTLPGLAEAAEIARTGVFAADTVPVSVTRVLCGTPGLVDWLNTQPYDTGAHAPANIYVVLQLRRASDRAVLWMGSAVTARDVGSDTLVEDVPVPVASMAAPGTQVFIQLTAVASPGVAYTLAGGFHFLEADPAPAEMLKRGDEGANRAASAAPSVPGSIEVVMVPNPVRSGSGDLHVFLQSPATASITVYDLLGNVVATVPGLVAAGAGEYVVPVDISALHDGLYVVEVRSGTVRGVARFTVMQ